MREIEFRAQRKDNKKWIYGNLLVIEDECFIITVSRKEWKKIQLEKIEVNLDTVGQYVGRKDKNGRKIYNGDILLFNFSSIGERKAVVLYSKERTAFLLRPVDNFMFTTMDNGVVIGNMHENPELLEASK